MKPRTGLSRSVALVLPFLFLAAFYSLVLAPLMDAYDDAAARIDSARNRIAHFKRAEVRLPALQADLDARKRSLPAESLFPHASAPETQSALQAAMQRLISASGVEALSSRLSSPASRGQFILFEAELELRASPPQLANLISSVEAAAPTLRVEKLSLSVPESGQGPVDDQGQPILTVHANIAGLAGDFQGMPQ